MEYKILIEVVEETSRAGEEWKKALKKFGAGDSRTREKYAYYMGMCKARQIVQDLVTEEEDIYDN